MPATPTGAAALVAPIVRLLLGGDPPVAIRCWDGSVAGSPDATTTVVVRSPRALRRLLYAPNELGLARAYVAGELDAEGDVFSLLDLRHQLAGRRAGKELDLRPREWLTILGAARRLGALGRPLPPPPEEARLRGRRHSKRRDAAAVAHHYDVSNDFYRLVLGPSMTYSCAVFPDGRADLEAAQAAKYELVCRKLGLAPGRRLLDVGCGWGGMVLHAAAHHGVEAVGITVSVAQQRLAQERVREAGLADRVEIRLQDYRDLGDERFDAVSSIGMFEHVGLDRLQEYFATLLGVLRPRGRLLNHAISRPPGRPGFGKTSFIDRYVFPDGELHEVGTVVSAMQAQGFEVRDVESLREHYARTLRCWVRNLEGSWDEAVALAGASRARIWRLYMAGSALNFEENRTSVHQVLGVRVDDRGRSGMPPTRAGFTVGRSTRTDQRASVLADA